MVRLCNRLLLGMESAASPAMKWLAWVALALAGTALAAGHEAEFKSLDLDGDGTVSLAEAAGNRELVTKFDRADRDHDGKLTRAEFEAIRNGRLPRKVARISTKERSAAAGGTATRKKTAAKAAN